LTFAGSISQASGQAYALIATPTAAFMHFKYKRKLAKRGELPSQVLKKRLMALDDLEKQLKAARP
jgi:hypothetical protein